MHEELEVYMDDVAVFIFESMEKSEILYIKSFYHYDDVINGILTILIDMLNP